MSPKKIVVVDDDEMIRKTFFLILQKKYLVYLAKDSKEALERFKNAEAEIDLIIADLKLPHINGIELISKFRKMGYKGEVIMISAYPDLINKKKLNRLSIANFFVKPLDLKALNRSIDCLLNTKSISGARL
jgi:YesN/AraC family two-component response regulator